MGGGERCGSLPSAEDAAAAWHGWAPTLEDWLGEATTLLLESFGALHQMLAGLTSAEQEKAWEEIGSEWERFEGAEGFEGPCELIVGWGVK